jgi:hypothetical protein
LIAARSGEQKLDSHLSGNDGESRPAEERLYQRSSRLAGTMTGDSKLAGLMKESAMWIY